MGSSTAAWGGEGAGWVRSGDRRRGADGSGSRPGARDWARAAPTTRRQAGRFCSIREMVGMKIERAKAPAWVRPARPGDEVNGELGRVRLPSVPLGSFRARSGLT